MPLVNPNEETLPGQPETSLELAVSFVFVVDQQRKPLDPVHPGRARYLLTAGHAAVLCRYPFTLILRDDKPDTTPQPLRIKLDPGVQTTGIAVVHDVTGQVMWAAEVTHRGGQIAERLAQRRTCRRSRRHRHTRYREPRFANRTRRTGWLPPSLESRIANVLTWVRRISRSCPIANISLELVKFDMQRMQNPEITGIQYQQGELAGYEVRQYLLEKFARHCAYCGKTDIPFEVEHIVPRSRGGSDRVSNLTLACHSCNQAKGDRTAQEFGHPDVAEQAQKPLKDPAAVNAARLALYQRLQMLGLPVEIGSGGLTKWNRVRRGLPKCHWIDATYVGTSTPLHLSTHAVTPLAIHAAGRHSRQMCRTNAYGFPDKAAKETSAIGGFRTGDIVHAVVPSSQR